MKVAVIGGGISGLSAAGHIQERLPSASITIYERSHKMGGKVGTLFQNGFIIEEGAESLNAQKQETLDLLRNFNLLPDVVAPCSGHFSLLDKNHSPIPVPLNALAPFPQSFWSVVSLPHVSWRGKAEWIFRSCVKRKQVNISEEVSLFQYLAEKFGRELAEKLMAPLFSGVYGGDALRLSSALLRTEKVRSPWGATFVGLTSGMQGLVEAMKAKASSALVLTEAVETIITDEQGVTIESTNSRETYDGVVIALPSKDMAPLFANFSPKIQGLLHALEVNSAAIVTLTAEPDALEILGTGGICLDRSQGFSGITLSSKKWEGRAPEGSSLLRVFFSGKKAEAPKSSLEEAATQFLAGLGVKSAKPMLTLQWIDAVPVFTAESFKVIRALREFEGVFQFAGASFDGSGIPDCVASGRNAADRLIRVLEKGINHGTTNSTRYHRRMGSTPSVL